MVNGCYMCKDAAETCSHVLLWCLDAYKRWSMVYGLLGISWVMAGMVRDEIWAWKSISRQRKFVDLIPLTIFWMM